MMHKLELNFVLFFALCSTGSSVDLPCNSKPGDFKFSLNSRRNSTGHLIAEVELQNKVGPTEKWPMTVDIDHSTANCMDSVLVHIFTNITVDPTAEPRKDGYSLVHDVGSYKFHTVGKSWEEAREICVKEGAHLLVVNSVEEMTAIQSMWGKVLPSITGTTYSGEIYVGIFKNNRKQFVTVNGAEPLKNTGYAKWGPGEPNNAGGAECCLGVRLNGELNDTDCKLNLAFVCEKEN